VIRASDLYCIPRGGYGVKMIEGTGKKYDEGPAYGRLDLYTRRCSLMGVQRCRTMSRSSPGDANPVNCDASFLFLHRCEDLVHLGDVSVRQFLELSHRGISDPRAMLNSESMEARKRTSSSSIECFPNLPFFTLVWWCLRSWTRVFSASR